MRDGTEPENWGGLSLTSLSPLRRGRRSLCPCQSGPTQLSMPLVGQWLAARCLGPRVRDPQMNPELKKIALWTV